MMNRKMARYSLLLISLSWPLVHATPCPAAGHVVLDGTLGSSGPLSGPDFNITANLGKTVGNNLFQSFSQFDLAQGDTARFTGPMNIQNIIARVTGGNASTINGTIDSTAMPKANFFFINPFGVLFGPNSRVSVSGSFAVTSASYVKLADGGRFDAVNTANDVLTTGPVSAFGFSGKPGTISFAPGSVSFDQGTLAASAAQSFSVIGGDITLNGATILAPGGRINLISVKSAGELVLDVTDFTALPDMSGFSNLGKITVQDTDGIQSTVATSGDGGGQIVIHGGTLVVQNSGIDANTTGGSDAKGVDIDITDDLIINGGIIASFTFGAGRGGDITIQAGALTMLNDAKIDAETKSSGAGGNITITATDTIDAENLSAISTATVGEGPGGGITLTAKSIRLDGRAGVVAGNSDGFDGTDNSGDITIYTGSLDVLNGSQITAQSKTPNSGNITITANSNIRVLNGSITASGVQEGGSITLSSPTSVYLLKSELSASATISGGNIKVDPPVVALNQSSVTATAPVGQGGNITFVTKGFLQQESTISVFGGVASGIITIQSPNVDLTGIIAPLPVSLFDAEAQLQPYCGLELSGNVSSFLVRGKGGVALEPSGASPSFELPPSDNETR